MSLSESQKYALEAELHRHLAKMPVLTLQLPSGWDYTPVQAVTAQSVIGTGLFSNITSTFTDAFGTQSVAFREKLQEGEGFCRKSLALQALDYGGNALLGLDVDYAEVGGTKAMLMVCMSATAVNLKNIAELYPIAAQSLEKAEALLLQVEAAQRCRFCGQRVKEPAQPCDKADDERLREAAPTIRNLACQAALAERGYL